METDITSLQGLLKQIEEINKRYAEVEKAYESSGVLYNIFDVLGLSSSEVGLHSTFIASLLRPGQHGAGTKFLEAFLRMSRLDLPSDFFDVAKVTVEQEKYIGPITETEGGRIDLILTDGNNSLIIENKIYANDQKNQLLRYYNFRPAAKLVFLSLYEDNKPSAKSLGSLPAEYVTCISYKTDIVQWLEECVRISANLPYIRETINQYIKTIQQLTNTSMSTNAEVISLLKEQNNLAAAFAVRNNLDHALNEIMREFVVNLKRDIERSCPGITCITDHTDNDWFMNKPRFLFSYTNWNNVFFGMEFEHSGLRDLTLGFMKKNEVKDIRQLEDVKTLAHQLGYDKKSIGSWFWSYPSSPDILNWNNAKSMEMLKDGRMIQWFVDTVNNVISCSKGLNL